jgi:hypothetical protein
VCPSEYNIPVNNYAKDHYSQKLLEKLPEAAGDSKEETSTSINDQNDSYDEIIKKQKIESSDEWAHSLNDSVLFEDENTNEALLLDDNTDFDESLLKTITDNSLAVTDGNTFFQPLGGNSSLPVTDGNTFLTAW